MERTYGREGGVPTPAAGAGTRPFGIDERLAGRLRAGQEEVVPRRPGNADEAGGPPHGGGEERGESGDVLPVVPLGEEDGSQVVDGGDPRKRTGQGEDAERPVEEVRSRPHGLDGRDGLEPDRAGKAGPAGGPNLDPALERGREGDRAGGKEDDGVPREEPGEGAVEAFERPADAGPLAAERAGVDGDAHPGHRIAGGEPGPGPGTPSADGLAAPRERVLDSPTLREEGSRWN